MNSPAVVVDTNVVVAGLLTADADSPTARILDGMRWGAFPFLLPTALLAEYRNDVIRRNGTEKSYPGKATRALQSGEVVVVRARSTVAEEPPETYTGIVSKMH